MKTLLLISILAQSQTLTVHDAVNEALRKHPAVMLAEASAARGEHVVREIASTRLPQLTLETSAMRFAEPMVVAPLHGLDPLRPPVFDRTLMQGSVSVAYTLFDASRGDRIARAQALADAASVQISGVQAQAIAETVRAYLRVRSARLVAGAQDKRLNALQRERDRAAQLVQEGRAARVVVLRADAALSAARADAVTAQSDVDVAQNELARLLDQPASAVRTAVLADVRTRDVISLDRDAALADATRNNADMRRLRLQREAAESERSAAKGTWLPRVQLGGRFIEYASESTSPQGEWQTGVQLSYPLYTGGARSAGVDRAGAEVRAADAELALGERRIAENVDRAMTALQAARLRVVALEAAVAQSEEVTRIDQLSLDAGAGVQTDYLNAEAELFRVRAALTEAHATEIIALLELARVRGQLTQEWLAVHLEAVI
jgi:outer membrane protein